MPPLNNRATRQRPRHVQIIIPPLNNREERPVTLRRHYVVVGFEDRVLLVAAG